MEFLSNDSIDLTKEFFDLQTDPACTVRMVAREETFRFNADIQIFKEISPAIFSQKNIRFVIQIFSFAKDFVHQLIAKINKSKMKKLFINYLQSITQKFAHEETSEMGYRTDFEILIKGIFESIKVKRIDHDAKAKQGNKPDFVVLKNDVPILYIEAKDIGVSLDKVEKSEQMTRYYGYTNLVLTDYVEFRFYRNGLRYDEPIKIANYNIKNRTIAPIPNNYEHVAKTLLDFTQSQKEPIKSGRHLSKIMGGRAQRIRDNVKQFLSNKSDKDAELFRVYETLKKLLVHDLSIEAFADMYAQTLVYGLFVARYHDETKKDFSRQEARDLIPKSNPLLQHFFDHIVGPSTTNDLNT